TGYCGVCKPGPGRAKPGVAPSPGKTARRIARHGSRLSDLETLACVDRGPGRSFHLCSGIAEPGWVASYAVVEISIARDAVLVRGPRFLGQPAGTAGLTRR